MGYDINALHPDMLRKMDKSQREAFGKDGKLPEERQEAAEHKLEKKLQSDIKSTLDRYGYQYIQNRMDKRSTSTTGAPDFVIIIPGKIILVECKVGKRKLSKAQDDFKDAAAKNNVPVHVVRTYPEFHSLLKSYGVA